MTTRHERIDYAVGGNFITEKWGNYLKKRKATHKTLDAALFIAEHPEVLDKSYEKHTRTK